MTNPTIEAILIEVMDYAFNKGLNNDGEPDKKKAKEWADKLTQLTKDVAEEERKKINDLQFSMPQTTYKSVFEKVAFQEGFKSAIGIIKNLSPNNKKGSE